MKGKVFDQYIVYYSPTRTKDSFGQKVETWAVYQKAFVSVDYSGSEEIQSERVAWNSNLTITGHYIPVVDTTYRILWEGNYYSITDIEPLNRKRWMRINASKIID